MTTRLTELVEPLPDGRLRCGVCQWCCSLGDGEVGRCLVRTHTGGGIAVTNHGLVSAANVGPVEEHRLWHFFPGTPVLSIGGWGYAFPADQQRGQYGRVPEEGQRRRELDPERVASVALDKLCRGVVWSYSDPSVAHEYVLDLLRTCRANSRYTALVTSGYATLAALDQLGHYLDGISLDLRAFEDGAYRRLTGADEWRGILEVAAHARRRWGVHIEVTTRLHPGVNDTPEQLAGLAGWILETLGPHTPWHVLPGDAGSAAAAAVARARRAGHEAGLLFVYGPEAGQATACSACSATVIDRSGGVVKAAGLDGGRCAACGEELHIRTSIFKRH
ncbi:MAG: radical SAM protein [Chloroflexota bacterium]|nr:MAG: radical SAM protein [Chloroflexota bacterium]